MENVPKFVLFSLFDLTFFGLLTEWSLFPRKISHRKTSSFELLAKHPRHFQSSVPPPWELQHTHTVPLQLLQFAWKICQKKPLVLSCCPSTPCYFRSSVPPTPGAAAYPHRALTAAPICVENLPNRPLVLICCPCTSVTSKVQCPHPRELQHTPTVPLQQLQFAWKICPKDL